MKDVYLTKLFMEDIKQWDGNKEGWKKFNFLSKDRNNVCNICKPTLIKLHTNVQTITLHNTQIVKYDICDSINHIYLFSFDWILHLMIENKKIQQVQITAIRRDFMKEIETWLRFVWNEYSDSLVNLYKQNNITINFVEEWNGDTKYDCILINKYQ